MSTTSLDLPDLSTDHPVSAEQVAELRTKGHTCVRGLLDQHEVEVYREVIESAAQRWNKETRPLDERDTYGKAFLQIHNLWQKDEAAARFTLARRFGHVAAQLLGVESVRLYHDQALFKEPGGGPTPWHQDQYYWPLDTDKTITMWMPLVDVPPEVGTMHFVNGSPALGYLGEFKISDESEQFFQNMIADRGLEVETHGAVAAGDTTWHVGWMLHSAPANPTPLMRSVHTVIYVADGARVGKADTPAHQDDLGWWLPGLQEGDLVASHLNPVVYP
jgi:ectoine hydroxylase-related dioxygenase (phytanoyl-CoA dioxygenase family)